MLCTNVGNNMRRLLDSALTILGNSSARRLIHSNRQMVHANQINSNVDSAGLFKVMTYNVLAEVHMSHYKKFDLYEHISDQSILDWAYRKVNLLDEMLCYSGDIICLQELEKKNYDEWFKPEFEKRGYRCIFKKKDTSPDGCAIFINDEMFSVEAEHSVEYSTLACEYVVKKRFPGPEAFNRLRKNDQVGVMLLLRHKATNQLLCVANTHLYWNPKFTDTKLWQTNTLLRNLYYFAKQEDMAGLDNMHIIDNTIQLEPNIELPVIVCGDFNTLPDTEVYNYMSKGQIMASLFKDYKYKGNIALYDHWGLFTVAKNTVLQQPFAFQSAYKAVTGQEPKYTNYVPSFKECIDYIWYHSGNNSSLKPRAVLEHHDVSVLSEFKVLPNKHLSSDHLSLLCEFELSQPQPQPQPQQKQQS